MTPRCPALVAWYTPDAIRFARSLARRLGLRNPGDRDDLDSEAIIGLIKGLDHYDPNHASGAQIYTYAAYWIKVQVERFIHWRLAGPASVPAHVLDTRHRPRTYAISHFVPVSDSPDDFERGVDLFEAGAVVESSEAEVLADSRRDHMWQVAARVLAPRLLYVLEQRTLRCRTLTDIGNELGCHRERVRQIQKDAVERLQLAMAREA